MESYTVVYSFITRDCDGAVFGGHTTTEIDGSTNSYSFSGLEENSNFNISIAAVNGAGSSSEPARISTNTLIAGRI